MAKKSKKAKSRSKSKVKPDQQPDIYLAVSLGLISIITFFSFIIINDRNLLGPFGEVIARYLYVFFGKASYVIPFITGFYSYAVFRNEMKYASTRYLAGFSAALISISLFMALVVKGGALETFHMEKVAKLIGRDMRTFWEGMPAVLRVMDGNYKFYTGGILGYNLAHFLSAWFNIIGAYIVFILLTALSFFLLGKEEMLFAAGRFARDVFMNAADYVKSLFMDIRNNKEDDEDDEEDEVKEKKPKAKKETEKPMTKKEEKEAAKKLKEQEKAEEQERKKPVKREKLNIITPDEPSEKKTKAIQAVVKGDYTLPSIDLLKGNAVDTAGGEKKDYAEDAEKLKKTLKDFGVEAEVVNVVDGPVISRFELELATGTKVSRVVNLADDIALSMRVEQVRVAPVPNKSLIGIEVPKSNKKTITLKELIETEAFQDSGSLLTMAIGKDLGGKAIIAELGKMPHLLIAGATGSGKSVCINSIIMSVIYKASPDEVKLVLVDPKRVELTHYRDIPHLISPVITDPKHAAYVLKKLTYEMDYRYDMLAKEGARDINTYNKMASEFNMQLKSEPDFNPEDLKKSLPYIILIIDELADLMTLAKANVEASLQRLAQLARAVGIHIVLATQRPSVDVITGVIKANFPSRIAFQVMSKVDSRTILDMNGADALLGRGDMLYAPADISKPLRGQAAFVSSEEISKVCHFIKKQRKPDISPEFDMKDDDPDLSGDGDTGTGGDEMMKKAIDLAKNKGNISTSYLQRKLGIGYSKAARMIDDMEEKGLITEADGNKPREYIGD
ncbi:MAG: cell division protein FtsK [Candidatus Goldiibacteriota bacterium HGW-Goldbacteria-1]|nr:MAG: cell division protein FtsK [Candidatus Goldiibacteriota bacterium HGW-Goldbacteria-1]